MPVRYWRAPPQKIRLRPHLTLPHALLTPQLRMTRRAAAAVTLVREEEGEEEDRAEPAYFEPTRKGDFVAVVLSADDAKALGSPYGIGRVRGKVMSAWNGMSGPNNARWLLASASGGTHCSYEYVPAVRGGSGGPASTRRRRPGHPWQLGGGGRRACADRPGSQGDSGLTH